MKVRILTAIIGMIVVLGLVWLGGIPFTAAVFAVAVLALLEYWRMLKKVNVTVMLKPAMLFLLLIIGASGSYSVPLFFGTILFSFIFLLYLILVLKQSEMNDLIYTVFGVLYFGVGFGALSMLRGMELLPVPAESSIEQGIFFILFALIGTWASDSFAYFAGKKWGKHKMAPHISPNKTMEGLVGGFIGCIWLDTVFAAWFQIDVFKAFVFSVVIGIMAPMGDLFESYIKRVCGLKDSGNILPGHGGMMDRFDSLLFVAPCLLAALLMFQKRGMVVQR